MNNWARRLIAVLQISGGSIGLVMMIISILSGDFSFGNYILSPIPLALFSTGVIAGVLLLRKKPKAIVLSTWYQALQIVFIHSGFASFSFYSGARLGFHWQDKPGFDSMLGSGFYFKLLSDRHSVAAFDPDLWDVMWRPESLIGINIFALVIFLYIRFCVLRSRKLAPYSHFQFELNPVKSD